MRRKSELSEQKVSQTKYSPSLESIWGPCIAWASWRNIVEYDGHIWGVLETSLEGYTGASNGFWSLFNVNIKFFHWSNCLLTKEGPIITSCTTYLCFYPSLQVVMCLYLHRCPKISLSRVIRNLWISRRQSTISPLVNLGESLGLILGVGRVQSPGQCSKVSYKLQDMVWYGLSLGDLNATRVWLVVKTWRNCVEPERTRIVHVVVP